MKIEAKMIRYLINLAKVDFFKLLALGGGLPRIAVVFLTLIFLAASFSPCLEAQNHYQDLSAKKLSEPKRIKQQPSSSMRPSRPDRDGSHRPPHQDREEWSNSGKNRPHTLRPPKKQRPWPKHRPEKHISHYTGYGYFNDCWPDGCGRYIVQEPKELDEKNAPAIVEPEARTYFGSGEFERFEDPRDIPKR